MTENEYVDIGNLRDSVRRIEARIGKKVIGSERIVRFMFVALLSNNHVLLEGVPGLAKTMLASEFSRHLCMDFKRIQFTPDMLPTDITGTMVFNLEERHLQFRKGPIFANVLLADEINRTPAKVQSALLEGMEEKKVSVGGDDHDLPSPFLVIATQNPIEQEGTFPLAEALMDRFLFRYILTYPSREEELNILKSITLRDDDIDNDIDATKILSLRKEVSKVHASEEIMSYIVDIIRRTREHELIMVGASPRTAAKYLTAVRANAMLNGREYVIPEDVRFISRELLNHRLILRPEALLESGGDGVSTVNKIIDRLISQVATPK
ncbi:MAG: MoxR family ATPase [Candidatus Thermoplasmatota archaeon]|nr:MoxR family ATPase [Candidatus Thermoplasmatota archaeon]MCL5955572.1 MoxR family ATPase [Candidatus Thermoplasmatota archaeon]